MGVEGGKERLGCRCIRIYLRIPVWPVESKAVKSSFHIHIYSQPCYELAGQRSGGRNAHVFELEE